MARATLAPPRRGNHDRKTTPAWRLGAPGVCMNALKVICIAILLLAASAANAGWPCRNRRAKSADLKITSFQ